MVRVHRLDGSHNRQGTTVVEVAVVLPVFIMFLFALFEFSHAYMVSNALNAAAKKAAREGSVEGVTTTEVEQRVREFLAPTIDTTHLTVSVKNADVFDSTSVDASNINYSGLPAIELSNAEERQLFIVRVEVPYDDVCITPPLWIDGITLKGQSVMRHE